MTRIGIWSVAILMAVYGLYSIWCAWSLPESCPIAWRLWYAVWGLIGIVGAVCLFLDRRWSRFFVYLIAVGIVGTYVYLTAVGIELGLWPYDSNLETAIAFVPVILVCVVCIASCFVVHRHFRGRST